MKKFCCDLGSGESTEQLGNCLSSVSEGFSLYLSGELGAGKTTLVRGILRGKGFEGVVRSPTYALLESYDFDSGPLYHFDLYRIGLPEELEAIGIEDYFTPEAICLVEWPEQGGEYLPKPDLHAHLVVKDLEEGRQGRQFECEAISPRGERFIERLQRFDQ